MIDLRRCVVVRLIMVLSCLAGKPRQLRGLYVCFPVIVVRSIAIATKRSLVVYNVPVEQLTGLRGELALAIYPGQKPVTLSGESEVVARNS